MDKEKTIIKFDKLGINETKEIIVDRNTNITINDIAFIEGVISRITFAKIILSNKREAMFIRLYMGNIELSITISYNEDFVISKYDRQICIRKAESYDY